MDKIHLVKAVISSFLTLTSLTVSINGYAASDDKSSEKIEKCYGIAKAGFNDCATPNASCAGSATKDKQGNAFIFVPVGVCDKITDGHLMSSKG
jgi:uncharacterized membrane protein